MKQYAEALDMLNSARKLLLAATGGEYLYGFELCVKDALSWADQPERAEKGIKKSVDGKIWHRLMSETGMFTLMSGKQRDEWDRQTDGEDMPEITLDTVLATFEQLHTHKNDTFEQGVIDVFRSLSWDYRTIDILPALKGEDSCFAESNLSRIKRFRVYRLSTS